jgi:hypothetical protein
MFVGAIMSDGRSFSKPQELSTEDRLAELERKIPVFLDRIKSYDTLFEMNEKYKARIEFLSSQNDQLLKKIDVLKEQQQQQTNDLTAKHNSACQVIDTLLQSDSHSKNELNEKIRTLQENQVIHMRHIDSLKKSLYETTDKMTTKQDLEDVKKLNVTSSELLKNRMDAWSKSLVHTIDEVEGCKSTINDITIHHADSFSRVRESFKNLNDNISNDRVIVKKLDENTLPMVKREIFLAIEQVKKLIPEMPTNIDSIRKDIQDQMHRIELDGKNSLLRSVNNEKLVEIMKKQIENIYLLLKKHELSQ